MNSINVLAESRCKLELTCTLFFQPQLLNIFCINNFTLSYKHIPAKEKSFELTVQLTFFSENGLEPISMII